MTVMRLLLGTRQQLARIRCASCLKPIFSRFWARQI